VCRVVDFDFVSAIFLLDFGTVLKVWDFLHFILIIKFQIQKKHLPVIVLPFLRPFQLKKSDNLISNNKTELCYSNHALRN